MLLELFSVSWVALGGGGMAQPSLAERLLSYLGWGVFVLLIGITAFALLRRIYRPAPRREPDETDDEGS